MKENGHKTLLEQALTKPTNKLLGKISTEEIDLLIAYVNGEVSSGQIAKVLGKPIECARSTLLTWLSRACRMGVIQVTRREAK